MTVISSSANFTFTDSLPLHLTNGRIQIRPNLLSFTIDGVEFEDRSIAEKIDEVDSYICLPPALYLFRLFFAPAMNSTSNFWSMAV